MDGEACKLQSMVGFHFSLLGQDIEHQEKKQKEKEEFLNIERKL